MNFLNWCLFFYRYVCNEYKIGWVRYFMVYKSKGFLGGYVCDWNKVSIFKDKVKYNM